MLCGGSSKMSAQDMSNWERLKNINGTFCRAIETDENGEKIKKAKGDDGLFRFCEEMYRVYTPENVNIPSYPKVESEFCKLFNFPKEDDKIANKLTIYNKFLLIKDSGDSDKQNTMEYIKNRFIVEYGDVCKGIKEFIDCFSKEDEKLKEDEKVTDYDKAAAYIEKNFYEENINKENKDKNAFIARLHNYRKNGIKDKNFEKELLHTAAHINDDKFRFLYELVQNADDCDYPDKTNICFSLKIVNGDNDQNHTKKQMIVSYPENGMTNSDIISISTIGESAKVRRRKKKKLIGEKGRGFHTIFSCCDEVKIYSNGFNFSLKSDEIQPNLIEPISDNHCGTTMVLILKDKIKVALEKNDNTETIDEKQKTKEQESKVASITFNDIAMNYGVEFEDEGKVTILKQKIINNCPILFTNKINEMEICEGEKVLKIIRKNNEKNTNKVKIEYYYGDNNIGEIELFCLNKDVQVDYDTYNGRYPDVFLNNNDYDEADDELKKYTITIACPVENLKENEMSIEPTGFSSNSDNVITGKLYSFMPTSVILNAPIIINLPIKLTENRGCIATPNNEEFIKKEGARWIAWNELFLKNTFITQKDNPSALKCFYEKIRDEDNINVLRYLPDFKVENEKGKYFFLYDKEEYSADVNRLNVYCNVKKENDIQDSSELGDIYNEYMDNIDIFKIYNANEINNEYVPASKAFVLDSFMHDIFKDVLEKCKVEERIYVDYNKFDDEQIKKAVNMGISEYQKGELIFGSISTEGEEKITNIGTEKKYEFLNNLLNRSSQRVYATKKIIEELYKGNNKNNYVNTTEPTKLEIIPIKMNKDEISYISVEKENVFVYLEKSIEYIPKGEKYKIIDNNFFGEETKLYDKLKEIYGKYTNIIKIGNDDKTENNKIIEPLEGGTNIQNFIDCFSIISSIKNNSNSEDEKTTDSTDWFAAASNYNADIYEIVIKCEDDTDNKDLEKLGLIRYYKEGKAGAHTMRLSPDLWDTEIRNLIRRGIQNE